MKIPIEGLDGQTPEHNPLELAKKMGNIAGTICRHLPCELAAIITLKGSEIAVYFGAPKKPDEEQLMKLTRVCGEQLMKLVSDIKEKKIMPIEMESGKGYVQNLDGKDQGESKFWANN